MLSACLCRLKATFIGYFLSRPELVAIRRPTQQFYNQSPRLQTSHGVLGRQEQTTIRISGSVLQAPNPRCAFLKAL